MQRSLLLSSLALGLVATAAQAQLRLPVSPLVSKPLDELERPLDNTLAHTADTLSELRQLQIERLVRANPKSIDTDPQGNPVVRSEILALAPTAPALAGAQAHQFKILREERIEALDFKAVVLEAPPGMSTRKALKELRALDKDGSYDFNHIYWESGAESADPGAVAPVAAAPAGIRVGLIDTGIARNHPVFVNTKLNLHGCDGHWVPADHGTAIASLMVGSSGSFHGVAPNATLYAVDVYCGKPTGGSLDAIVGAFAWLVENQVAVINVSLVGPKNALLERIIAALIAKGFLVVAAVGNDGPAAPPLYPASYPHVVGVTAVDARKQALIEAARGPQVMFAAPGADMAAAGKDALFAAVRGTSFASPLVAALLAAQLPAPDPAKAASALKALEASAEHLGKPGRDLTYGYGLVGMQFRAELAEINPH